MKPDEGPMSRKDLATMNVGEERRYPKSTKNRYKLSNNSMGLYCKGYNFIVSSKKEWDYILVRRLS